MASKIIGRAPCPECGFSAAHVKKSDKCVYRYCPDCGAQHHARTERQSANLMKQTRLDAAEGVPTPTEPSPTPTGTAPAAPVGAAEPAAPTGSESTPTPTAAPKRRGLFS